jgi:hypothetical protein
METNIMRATTRQIFDGVVFNRQQMVRALEIAKKTSPEFLAMAKNMGQHLPMTEAEIRASYARTLREYEHDERRAAYKRFGT